METDRALNLQRISWISKLCGMKSKQPKRKFKTMLCTVPGNEPHLDRKTPVHTPKLSKAHDPQLISWGFALSGKVIL